MLIVEQCERTQNEKNEKNSSKKDVITSRKACKTDGTDLSHYILMDKKTKESTAKRSGAFEKLVSLQTIIQNSVCVV